MSKDYWDGYSFPKSVLFDSERMKKPLAIVVLGLLWNDDSKDGVIISIDKNYRIMIKFNREKRF